MRQNSLTDCHGKLEVSPIKLLHDAFLLISVTLYGAVSMLQQYIVQPCSLSNLFNLYTHTKYDTKIQNYRHNNTKPHCSNKPSLISNIFWKWSLWKHDKLSVKLQFSVQYLCCFLQRERIFCPVLSCYVPQVLILAVESIDITTSLCFL